MVPGLNRSYLGSVPGHARAHPQEGHEDGLQNLYYEERLRELVLFNLEKRRLQAAFRYFNGS